MIRADKLVSEVEIDGLAILKQGAICAIVLLGVPWAVSKVAETILDDGLRSSRTSFMYKITDWR